MLVYTPTRKQKKKNTQLAGRGKGIADKGTGQLCNTAHEKKKRPIKGGGRPTPRTTLTSSERNTHCAALPLAAATHGTRQVPGGRGECKYQFHEAKNRTLRAQQKNTTTSRAHGHAHTPLARMQQAGGPTAPAYGDRCGGSPKKKRGSCPRIPSKNLDQSEFFFFQNVNVTSPALNRAGRARHKRALAVPLLGACAFVRWFTFARLFFPPLCVNGPFLEECDEGGQPDRPPSPAACQNVAACCWACVG